jgi:hypothetical protein
MKMIVKLTLAAALTVASLVPTQARESHKRIYSNVTAEDMRELLSDVALLSYGEASNKEGNPKQHQLLVTWYGADGKYHWCFYDEAPNTWGPGTSAWKPEIVDSKRRKERYPLVKHGTKRNAGYRTLRYDADGNYKKYQFYKGLWWLGDSGHLQKSLPAAVYEMCPDFPSAKSLGAKVNKRQTSTNYFELIKQDPGDRVKRPDLITAFPVERY